MREEKMQAAKQMSPQERDEIMSAATKVNDSLDESMIKLYHNSNNHSHRIIQHQELVLNRVH